MRAWVALILAWAWPLIAATPGPSPKNRMPSGPERRITLVAVGDVMMARGVERVCRQRGWDYPFQRIGEELRRADIAFGNLECPVSSRGEGQERQYTFRADTACLPALRRAGFTVLAVANNHAMDYGRQALSDTLTGLRKHGIQPIGAGRALRRALRGTVIRVAGISIGFLGFSAFPQSIGPYEPREPSIAPLNARALRRAIRAIRRRCDVVVVSCHWGIEGVPYHDSIQESLAHLAVESGAALVLGHHPHVPEEVERYRGGIIVYSLGNCVFDERPHNGPSGLLFRCTLDRTGVVSYSTNPLRIRNCRPELLINAPHIPRHSSAAITPPLSRAAFAQIERYEYVDRPAGANAVEGSVTPRTDPGQLAIPRLRSFRSFLAPVAPLGMTGGYAKSLASPLDRMPLHSQYRGATAPDSPKMAAAVRRASDIIKPSSLLMATNCQPSAMRR